MTPRSDPPSGTTLAELGEFGLLRVLTGRFEQGQHVFVGPGDDAAVVRTPQGHVVVSTDLLVEGRHFRRDWAGAREIGRKAAAANLSDLNAMGGTAHSLTVGLALPPTLDVGWVLELVDGIAEEAALVGASIVGGDLTTGAEVVVAITALGACELSPVRRDGAQTGDVVGLAGRQGWAAAGLAVLARGFRSPRVLVEAYQRPQPPYGAGIAAARAGATSMIDVSDGLLADLGHLAAASGTRIDLRSDAFDLAEPLRAVGAALGTDPMQFVLGGGDDHAIAATFPAGSALPEGFTAVGSVRSAGEAGEAGKAGEPGQPAVTVDGAAYDGPSGWSHFA